MNYGPFFIRSTRYFLAAVMIVCTAWPGLARELYDLMGFGPFPEDEMIFHDQCSTRCAQE